MAKSNGANVGFEEKLWAAANKMRGNMDPAEYKHIVLGLIFLKYISDSFEALHKKVTEKEGTDEAEDRDYYLAENVFWVPKEARWNYLRDNAKDKNIGKMIDNAMYQLCMDSTFYLSLGANWNRRFCYGQRRNEFQHFRRR